jgi:hypothetical protein
MKTMKKELKRSFGGKLGNFTNQFNDKQEKSFEKKHLAAYLKGNRIFYFGRVSDGFGGHKPAEFKVNEVWS